MSLMRPLMTAGFLMMSAACQQAGDKSESHQLVENDFVCPADPERRAATLALYDGFLKGGTATHRASAHDAVAVIPDEYLRWNFDHARLPVELRQVGGSVRGVTTSQGIGDVWYPVNIWVGQPTGNFNPLAHELGHATQHYVKRALKGFQAALDAHYQWAVGSVEAQAMRSYAKSSATEMFAEIFDSYYCGSESRDHMAARMPRTLEFARTWLIDPERLVGGTTGRDTVQGRLQKADADGDGVAGAHDRCPGTAAGDEVAAGRETYGCSDNQLQ